MWSFSLNPHVVLASGASFQPSNTETQHFTCKIQRYVNQSHEITKHFIGITRYFLPTSVSLTYPNQIAQSAVTGREGDGMTNNRDFNVPMVTLVPLLTTDMQAK